MPGAISRGEETPGLAAPDHHRVVFESDVVRVLETPIRSGDTTSLHTHLTPRVMCVVSGSHFVRRDGEPVVDTRANPDFTMPRVLDSAGTPIHALENAGPDDQIVIGVGHKPLIGGG